MLIWKALILAGLALVALTIAMYIFWFRTAPISKDPSHWADFGNYASGVGGLVISLLTLIAVVYSLQLQRKEISTAIGEFSENRKLSQAQFESSTAERQATLICEQLGTLVREVDGDLLAGSDISCFVKNEGHVTLARRVIAQRSDWDRDLQSADWIQFWDRLNSLLDLVEKLRDSLRQIVSSSKDVARVFSPLTAYYDSWLHGYGRVSKTSGQKMLSETRETSLTPCHTTPPKASF